MEEALDFPASNVLSGFHLTNPISFLFIWHWGGTKAFDSSTGLSQELIISFKQFLNKNTANLFSVYLLKLWNKPLSKSGALSH